MEQAIQISIIVPVYNAEQYLSRCIDSILAQQGVTFQLILVDDGSRDGSGRICDEYAVRDERITVIHVENGGPARARNIGMDQARGKYIGFVDADDYIEPNMYAVLFSKAEEYSYEITTCGFDLVRNSQVIGTTHPELEDGELIGTEQIQATAVTKYYSDNAGTWPSLWNKLYLQEFIEAKHTRIDESLIRAEDYWFNFTLLCRAQRIGSVNQIFYHYVQDNQASTMHSVRENQYSEWKASRQKLLRRADELGIHYDCKTFARGFLYNVAIHLQGLVWSGKWDKARDILADSYYIETMAYDSNLPAHVRLLHALAKKRLYAAAYLLLWMWGKRS